MRRTHLAVAVAAAIVALAWAVPTTGSAAPRPAPCSAAGLLIWIPNGLGSGTAGSVYYRLELTNLSARTCTLSGFPAVSAVNLAGRRIGRPARHEPSGKGAAVTLAFGASAVARLRIVEAGAISPSACHMRTAAGLRVRPPGGRSSRLVPLLFAACARGGSVLSVGPLTALPG